MLKSVGAKLMSFIFHDVSSFYWLGLQGQQADFVVLDYLINSLYLGAEILPYMTLLCHIQIKTFVYKTFRMESIYL